MPEMDAFVDAAESASSGGNGNSTEAGIPEAIHYPEDATRPIVKTTPKVMIDGSRIVGFEFNGRIDEEQNIRKTNEWNDGLEITIEDPETVVGSLWVEKRPSEKDEPSEDALEYEESDEWIPTYFLVDEDNENVEVEFDIEEDEDGNPQKVETGVRIHGYKKEAVRIEDGDIDYQYARFFVDGSGGQYLGKRLDTAGGVPVEWRGDEKSMGLVETPPGYFDDETETDLNPAFRRTPTLRADLIDRPIRFLVHRGNEYEGNFTKLTTPFKMDDDGEPIFDDDGTPEAYTPLEETDDAFAPPEYNPIIYWDEQETGAEAEPESGDMDEETPSFDFSDGDSGNGESEELTFEDLGTTGQAFVEQFPDSVSPSELDDFDERVEAAKDEGLDAEVTAADMRRIIEAR